MREYAGKMRARITPNTDTFYTVYNIILNLKNKYVIFCIFFHSNLMPNNFCKSCHMLFSFVRISHHQRPRCLSRWIPFIKATLGAVDLITLAWLGHMTWRYAIVSFWYVFPPTLVAIVYLEVALLSFNKLLDHGTYRNIEGAVRKLGCSK